MGLLDTGVPEVNVVFESNGYYVGFGSVENVEVEIILEVWGVEYFIRGFGDLADVSLIKSSV